jgi:hypothetical protein
MGYIALGSLFETLLAVKGVRLQCMPLFAAQYSGSFRRHDTLFFVIASVLYSFYMNYLQTFGQLDCLALLGCNSVGCERCSPAVSALVCRNTRTLFVAMTPDYLWLIVYFIHS